MKILLSLFLSVVCVCAQSAPPSAQVIESCLANQSIQKMHYEAIEPEQFDIVEDEDEKSTTKKFTWNRYTLGLRTYRDARSFSLILNNINILAGKVVRLDTDAPQNFEPTLASWGHIQTVSPKSKQESYICVSFNFDGIGQSGSFQNVRGIYLIDLAVQKKAKAYYLVKILPYQHSAAAITSKKINTSTPPCNPSSSYVDEMAACKKQELDQAKQTYELLFKAIKKSKPLPKEISTALNDAHQNLQRYANANCVALTEYGLPGAGRESLLHYLGCITQTYQEKIKQYQYLICPAAYFEGSDPSDCDEVKAIGKKR